MCCGLARATLSWRSALLHRPSSPAKAGDPVFQSVHVHHQRSGILGRPVEPGDDHWVWLLVLATGFARALSFRLRLCEQRAQGRSGCAPHPRSRVPCASKRKCTRAYRFGGSIPAFPAQWFDGLCRALPGDRLCCHHRPRKALGPYRRLDASPGRQDHTISPCARCRYVATLSRATTQPASTAACPHVRDVRERPSGGTGWPH